MRNKVFALIDCNNFYVSCERVFNASVQTRPVDDLAEFGQTIKARVLQFTGIPVSVGIASTKSLSKIAVEIVKHDQSYNGVLDLTALSEQKVDELLAAIAIEDVWGIGPKYARFLRNYGVDTAKALKDADEKWIRKYLTVTGERIVLELRGISCIPIELERPPKQAILCSKTFGKEITSQEEMQEAIGSYTARAAEKLREQDSLISCLTIFIRTNTFNPNIPHYTNSFTVTFPYPTAFTPELVHAALEALKRIYQEGFRYKKAGVYLTKITPQSALQPDLFGDYSLIEQYRQARFMAIVDAINRIYGRDTLFLGSQGIARGWRMQQRKLSQRYTTQWSEILTI